MRIRFGANAVTVVNHWDGDEIAIGIAKASDPRVLVYVAVNDAEPTPFYAELELPSPNDTDMPYAAAGTRSNLSLAALLDLVAEHFALQSIGVT